VKVNDAGDLLPALEPGQTLSRQAGAAQLEVVVGVFGAELLEDDGPVDQAHLAALDPFDRPRGNS
jgi:hypothetical protein